MTTHNEENRLYRIRIKTFQKNQQSLHARKKKTWKWEKSDF